MFDLIGVSVAHATSRITKQTSKRLTFSNRTVLPYMYFRGWTTESFMSLSDV